MPSIDNECPRSCLMIAVTLTQNLPAFLQEHMHLYPLYAYTNLLEILTSLCWRLPNLHCFTGLHHFSRPPMCPTMSSDTDTSTGFTFFDGAIVTSVLPATPSQSSCFEVTFQNDHTAIVNGCVAVPTVRWNVAVQTLYHLGEVHRNFRFASSRTSEPLGKIGWHGWAFSAWANTGLCIRIYRKL